MLFPFDKNIEVGMMAGYVGRGEMPGIVALASRHFETYVNTMGSKAFGHAEPMRRMAVSQCSMDGQTQIFTGWGQPCCHEDEGVDSRADGSGPFRGFVHPDTLRAVGLLFWFHIPSVRVLWSDVDDIVLRHLFPCGTE
jgi:hypothetical protein